MRKERKEEVCVCVVRGGEGVLKVTTAKRRWANSVTA